METTRETPASWVATMDGSGRVLLPAELRNEMKVEAGTQLVWIKDEHGLHLKSFEESLAEIQSYYQSLSPAEDGWTDALLKERRAEAEHD